MRIRRWAAAGIVLCVLGLSAFGAYKLMNSRTFQLFGEIVPRVETEEKLVALTFDDGPAGKTPAILALLSELDVRCTFFLIGGAIEDHMDDARAIVQAGHQIGNHSYSHERLLFKSMTALRKEIEKTNVLIREAGYTGEILFRPPYLKKLVLLPLVLRELDMTTITCDIEPDSYVEVAKSAESIAAYVIKNVRPGSIVLLHIMNEGNEAALTALPAIVSGLRAEGYRFVTVNELLDAA